MSIEDPTEIMYAFQSGKDLFRNSEGVGSAIHAVIAVIGLALMPLVLTAVVRDFKKTPSSPIILSICLGDSFYLLISLIYGIADASSNRWYFGYIGCVVNHIVVLAACYISILSLALLTLERYMGIVHRKPMTVTHTLPIVLLIWFISFLFAFWPLLTNSVEYGIMLSLICSFNWATQNRVLLLIPVWMSIIVLVIGLFFIAFGYFQIVSLYFSVKKGLQDVKTQNPSSDTHDKQGKVDNAKITFSDADKRLLMKAIALTISC
ncbi:hypothetical protein EDD86DRAFT_248589 [Gorgonomyces haynaldii]|nr:hypothetical protein EDD86DRAFT_248589 [Gorgonomyces haynaldii]